MIFTCDEPAEDSELYQTYFQFIKDEKGYIIGCIEPRDSGWMWQSCIHEASPNSWAQKQGPEPTRQDAINMTIADYIARRME